MKLQLDRSEVDLTECLVFESNCRSYIIGFLKSPPDIPEDMHIEDARDIYREARRDIISRWPLILKLRRETNQPLTPPTSVR